MEDRGPARLDLCSAIWENEVLFELLFCTKCNDSIRVMKIEYI